MTGFNLKGILPPRPSTDGTETVPPAKHQQWKTKAPSHVSSSHSEPQTNLAGIARSTPLSGVVPPSQLRMILLGNDLSLNTATQDSSLSELPLLMSSGSP